MGKRFWWFATAIVAVAFIMRVFVVMASHPWSDNYERLYIYADARNYHNLAVELAQKGSWAAEPKVFTAVFAPGYPLFLGFLYKIFGVNVTTALLVNALLSALTCLFLILLTRVSFGDWAGLATGALLALHPHSIRFTAMLYSESLYMFFATCFLMSLVLGQHFSQGCRSWLFGIVLASLAAALAVTTRISMLYFAPLVAVIWYIATRQSWKSAFARVVVFTALFIVWLSPWALYNKGKYGTYRLSASGEFNFLALTVAGSLAPDIDTYHDYKQELLAEAYRQARAAGARNVFEVSPYFLKVAYEKIQERPTVFAAGMVKGFFNLWFRPIQSRSERAAELTRDLKNLIYIYYSYVFQGILFMSWIAVLLLARRLSPQWVILAGISILYFWIAVGNAAYSRFFLQALPYILPPIGAVLAGVRITRQDEKGDKIVRSEV